jgi:hypothetical protein
MFVDLKTPILVEVAGKGPALAIGSVEIEGQPLAFVVIAKNDGQVSVKAISRLRGAGDYVTGKERTWG